MQWEEPLANAERTMMSERMNDLTGAYSMLIEAVCQCPIAAEKKRLRLKVVLGSLEREVADALIAGRETSARSQRR